MNKISYMNAASEWLELKKISVKYSTYVKYASVIDKHIQPYFQTYMIEDVDEDKILNFFHSLFNDNRYANSTLLMIRYVVKGINQFIQMKYKVTYCSMELVKISRNMKSITTLTKYQTSSLSNHCFTYYKPICIAVLIGLYAGLRIGEICALKWEDVSYEEGCIRVYKTIERLKCKEKGTHKTKLMSLSPKTNSSKRIVPIPSFLLEYVQQYQKQVEGSNSSDYIITSNNKIPDPRTTQYRFTKLCEEFDFTINFHALRHSYATNCIMQEIDTKSLSEILGHSTVGTTLNLYVHSSLEFKKKQIDKITRL